MRLHNGPLSNGSKTGWGYFLKGLRPEPPRAQEPVTAASLMQQAGMVPDACQEAVFTSEARQQLLLWHRQRGKSTAVAALAWEQACNVPGSLTLLISRTLRQSSELFRKVKQFHQVATVPLTLIRDTALSLETSHHSRIISLPAHADTVVGYSAPALVVIDEAARVPDTLYYALRPMLAMSRGSLIALSTPWGRRGWFYEAWEGTGNDTAALDAATVQALLADLGIAVSEDELGDETPGAFDWHRSIASAVDSPRLDKRFLANERRTVPDMVFRSEWLCEFTESEGSVFRWEDVQAMLSDDVRPMWYQGDASVDAVAHDVLPLFPGVA